MVLSFIRSRRMWQNFQTIPRFSGFAHALLVRHFEWQEAVRSLESGIRRYLHPCSEFRDYLLCCSNGSGAILAPQIRTATRSPGSGT